MNWMLSGSSLGAQWELSGSLLQLRVLGLYELFIDVNKPLKINEMFVGRSISISWLRKFDHDNGDGFYVFDVGIILNVHHNTVQICFQGYEKSYKMVLDLND